MNPSLYSAINTTYPTPDTLIANSPAAGCGRPIKRERQRVFLGALAQILVMLCILHTEAHARNNSNGAKVRYNSQHLDMAIVSNGLPVQVGDWKLGSSPGYARKFQVIWNLYDAPKVIELSWKGPNGRQTHTTSSLTGSYLITLPASGPQEFSVTVRSKSKAGWQYSVVEWGDAGVRDVRLAAYPVGGADPARAIFSASGVGVSGNQAATADVNFQPANNMFPKSKYNLPSQVFRVVVPNGVRAFRVKSETGVYLSVQRGSIAAPVPGSGKTPAKTVTGREISHNATVPNSVSWTGARLMPGLYYITVFAPTTRTTKLWIDCFMAGHWRPASFQTNQGASGTETEKILVGIENKTGADLSAAGSGRVTLIAHGRTDSPRGKTGLGDAAGRRWERMSYYLNWSEGSYSNTPASVGLQGSRFIPSACEAMAAILAERGIRADNVDFIGHSWGTFVGGQLANRLGGKFHRFFALDPARIPPADASLGFQFWPAASLVFAQLAQHSLSIHGWNDSLFSYGDRRLAQTAHHSVFLFCPRADSANLHSQPVKVMETLLESPPASTDLSLLGKQVRMTVQNSSATSTWLLSDLGGTTVGNGVEYARFFGSTVVPGAADIDGSSLSLSYAGISAATFSSAQFNGYVLEFNHGGKPLKLRSASVTSASGLGLGNSRVWVEENRLYVNVASLPVNASSSARIEIKVDHGEIAKAFSWILDKQVNESKRPWLAPYGFSDIGIGPYAVGITTETTGNMLSMRFVDKLTGKEVALP